VSQRDDETWTIIGLIALYFIVQSGGDFWEKLFGTSSGDRVVPMPDWKQPAYEPKEIEITEPKLTPATFDEMAAAYMTAFKRITGDAPSQHLHAMLLAQSGLETSQWKEMYEWNPANITTLKERGFYRLKNDLDHKYAPYPDRVTGAMAHLALLVRKYPKSLSLMLTGSPAEVAAMLKKEGPFYEAPESTYARGLSALFKQFLSRVPGPVTS
jgi:hypothetical protein